MRVLLYTPSRDVEDARRLHKVVGNVAGGKTLEVYKSLEALVLRLQKVLYDQTIIVLFAEDRQELLRIQAMSNILSSVPVFLVIPDQEQESIAIAHSLRPRFLTSRDSDYADLGAVLRKKLSSGDSRHRKMP